MPVEDATFHYYGEGSNYAVDVLAREEGRYSTIHVTQVATGHSKVFPSTTPFVQACNFCETMSAGAWASHFPDPSKSKKGKKEK